MVVSSQSTPKSFGCLMSTRAIQAIQLLKGMPGIVLVQLLRGLPGIFLVAAGGMMIYFAATLTAGTHLNPVPYVVAFGFLIAAAGIVLLFREMGQAGAERAGFDPSKAASDIERVLGQLGKNYDILRQHTKAGFILAALFMTLGILVILAGSAGQLLGFTEQPNGVTAVAGLIVESVSVIGFYLFRTSFKELTATSERLHAMLLLLDAFKRAEALPQDQKTQVTVALIQRLVDYGGADQSAAQPKAA